MRRPAVHPRPFDSVYTPMLFWRGAAGTEGPDKEIFAIMQPQTGVRDACDSCHSKKIRCERIGDACRKCVQQKSPCVFSPRTKNGTRLSSVVSARSRRRKTARPPSRDEGFQEVAQAAVGSPEARWAFDFDSQNLDFCDWVDTSGRSSSEGSSSFMEPGIWRASPIAGPPLTATICTSSLPSTAPTSLSGAYDSRAPSQEDDDEEVGRGDGDGSDVLECLRRISKLSMEIFRHAKRLAQPGPDAADGRHRNQHAVPQPLLGIDQTLSFSQPFLEILSALCSSADQPSRKRRFSDAGQTILQLPSGLPDDGPASPVDLDDATVLLICSSSLRLIRLYDDFFGHMMHQLATDGSDALRMVQNPCGPSVALPSFSIGSFMVSSHPSLQLCFLVEYTVRIYDQLVQAIQKLRLALANQNSAGVGAEPTSIAETTFQSLLNYVCTVTLKRERLRSCIAKLEVLDPVLA